MRCAHLAETIGIRPTADGSELEHRCRHPAHGTTTLAGCALCPDFFAAPDRPGKAAALKHPGLTESRHPLGTIINAAGDAVDVRDLFRGATAFAVLGGPSLKTQRLELLARRGCLIISTNNCPANLPAGIKPHVWIHTDPTHKFHDGLWHDPGILKFTPTREWASSAFEAHPTTAKPKGIRTRAADGRLEFLPGVSARGLPGVLGYHRNTTFCPDSFLSEPTINRGNDKDSHATNGWPHVINTMFSVLRLSYYLGVSRLILLGADFKMRAAQPYGFSQGKHLGGVSSNNQSYAQMLPMLDALRPKFDAAGFTVLNATPGSHLWSFEFVDFETAVSEATQHVPQELKCDGWYDDVKPRAHAQAG